MPEVRLIDANALAESDMAKLIDKYLYNQCNLTVGLAAALMPEIEAASKWIPCSERMPESRAVVIFTVNRGYPFVCVGYRINSERDGLKLQRWFCKLSKLNFSNYDVTAWMPMPEAYKEDDDDDT